MTYLFINIYLINNRMLQILQIYHAGSRVDGPPQVAVAPSFLIILLQKSRYYIRECLAKNVFWYIKTGCLEKILKSGYYDNFVPLCLFSGDSVTQADSIFIFGPLRGVSPDYCQPIYIITSKMDRDRGSI